MIDQVGDPADTTVRRILLLSHTHAFGAFRVGSHHYARTLALRGFDVVHLSTPISLAHRVTRRVTRAEDDATPRRPHQDDDGVTHVIPRTVLPRPSGRFRVQRELARHNISPTFDAVLIDQPLLWDDSVRALSRTLVYRPTDLYPSGIKQKLQREIIRAADGVVTTSAEVHRALGTLHVPSLVLENGVDAARFTFPEPETAPRPAVCAYVGALDERFDWQQVASWAKAHPVMRFMIAGPHRAPPIALPPNVELLGAVAYDSLPAFLHGARVGLLPLSADPLNAGRSPMKLYEYLAAGLSVVARATPVLQDDVEAGVFTYSDDADSAAAIERALSRSSPNTPGTQYATAQSWDAKTDALVAFLAGLPGW